MADTVSILLDAGIQISPQEQSKFYRAIEQMERGAPKINLQFNTAGGGFGQLGKDVSQFTSYLDRANQRVISFTSSVSVLYTTIKFFKDIVSATIEVDKALTDINSTMKLSSGNLDRFSKDLFNVARATSTSFTEAAEAAKEFSRQGLNQQEVIKRTTDALTLSRIAGIDAADSVKELTQAVNIFAKSGTTTTDVVRALSAVSANFAVSTKDVSDGFTRFGAVAQQAGLSFNQTIALITALKQSSQRDGAAIGTALTSIFEKLQPKAALDSLNRLGVEVHNAAGGMLPTIGVVQNLAKSYDTLGAAQKAQVDKMVGGTRQIEILKAGLIQLANANGTYAQAQKVAASGADSVTDRLNAQNQSIQALLTNFGSVAKQVNSNIGQLSLAPILKTVLGASNDNPITKALEDASGHAESAGGKIAEGLLRGLGNAFIYGLGPILALAGSKIAARTFGSLINDIKDQAGLNAEAKEQASIQQEIVNLYKNGGDALQQQIAGMTTLAGKAALVLEILQKQRAAQEIRSVEFAEISSIVKSVPRAASGYLSVGSEAAAIAAGVGGAPTSAHPVIIPNFRYGPGQIGPIVANSSEYKVDLGTGDAIYSQDMVKSMGLPSNAVPIAAGGYMPFGRSEGQEVLRNAGGQPLSNASLAEINDLLAALSPANGQAIAGTAAALKDLIKTLNEASQQSLQRAILVAAQPIFNASSSQASPEAIAANLAYRNATGGFGTPALSAFSAGGSVPFRDVTGVEKGLGKDLRSLSNDQLTDIGALNGTKGQWTRNDLIQTIRGELSASQRNGGDVDRIKTTLGLASSGTLNSDFSNTVKTLLGTGKTSLEDAYKQASDAYIAAGGTAKRLANAQTSLADSLIEYGNSVRFESLNGKATQGAITRQTTFNEAKQQLEQGASFLPQQGSQTSLNREQRAAIANNLREQAISKLGFSSLGSTADVLANPAAKAQVDQIVAVELAKLKVQTSSGLTSVSDQVTPGWYARNNSRLGSGNLGLAAAIGLPFAGGLVAELGGAGGTGRGQAVGGLSGALNGAGTGLGAGLLVGQPLAGGLIGGAVGGLIGVFNKLSQSFQELADEITAKNNKIKADYDKAAKVFEIEGNLKDAYANGADPDTIKALKRDRADALADITDQRLIGPKGLLIQPGAFSNPDTQTQVNAIYNADTRNNNRPGELAGAFNIARSSSSRINQLALSPFGGVAYEPLVDHDAVQAIAQKAGGVLSGIKPSQLETIKIMLRHNQGQEAGDYLQQLGGVSPSQIELNRPNIGTDRKVLNDTIIAGIQQAIDKKAPADIGDDADAAAKAAGDLSRQLREMSEYFKTTAKNAETFAQGFIKVSEAIQKASQATVLQTEDSRLRSQGGFDQANIKTAFGGQAQQTAFNARAGLLSAIGKAGLDPTNTGTQDLIDKVNGASSIDQFKALQKYVSISGAPLKRGVPGALATGDTPSNDEYVKLLEQTVEKLTEIKTSQDVSLFVAKTTNDLLRVEAQSHQKDALLSNARYDPSAFASIQLQSRLGGVGSNQGIRLQSLLNEQGSLSSLGIPQTDTSLKYTQSLEGARTRQTLAELAANRLGAGVGSSPAALSAAAAKLQGASRSESDNIFGQRLQEAVSLQAYSPQKQIADIQAKVGSSPQAFQEALAKSGLGASEQFSASIENAISGPGGTNSLLQILVDAVTGKIPASGSTSTLTDALSFFGGKTPHIGVGGGTGAPTLTQASVQDPIKANAYTVTRDRFSKPGKFDSLTGFGTGFSDAATRGKAGTDSLEGVGAQVEEGITSSFNRAWDSFITGSERAGKAFKSFAAGITADASRAFADQGIRQLLGAFGSTSADGSGGWTQSIAKSIGSLFTSSSHADGGVIALARGGKVPAMLTGGEFHFGAQAARSIGYDKLNAINRGYASGGLVHGGSGMRDDVPASLDPGSFIIKKSAVKRYGAGRLQALANRGYALGGRVGYDGGGDVDLSDFSSGAGATDFSSSVDTSIADGSASTAGNAAASATGASAYGGVYSAAFAFVLGLVERYLNKSPGLLDTAQTTANANNMRAVQQADFANPSQGPAGKNGSGSNAYLVPDGNGGYQVLNYGGAPASVTNYSNQGMSNGGALMQGFSDGGAVSPMPPPSSSVGGTPNASVQVTVHNYGAQGGGTSASTQSKGNDPQSTEFAKQMGDQVNALVQKQLVDAMRTGGIFSQQRRFSPSASSQ